mmetsp:Transcript_103076/g.162912  ORF Transcript_103076/g.162912 Transcript_103076/m.162912 type:complete len:219 (-) Transcript_103076:83-739(-)|eukprot:CAMPEP_0169113560 /NCGR_PEP_ID=MMETSP1015-20121227/28274_1 /TAXON_ID=342587 /ORGANISM="Karlodinium micrum, Strain CCMP2283" /LENGTH=218 /DNA_ID=CAMNT_0009175753 /DNA_START=63 /DNA_END=719 /DNA_ORIENTATION=-
MIQRLLLTVCALACAGCEAASMKKALRGEPVMSDAIMAMVQGPMLLSAALPHHGTPPSKELQEQMDHAGTKFYDSYVLLQSAEQSVSAASEQLKTGESKIGSAATSGIADAEEMIQRAAAKMKEAEELQRDAKDKFYNNANPLADPPEAPHEWDNINAMGMRSRSKIDILRDRVKDVRHLARQRGLSLISVSSEKAVAIQDPYGAKQDDKLLDFLNHY